MKRRLWLALAASAIATQARAQFGGRNRRPSPKKDETPQVNTIEVTLYELEEDLKLTDSQRPLWQSYADKVRAMISDAARERARAKSVAQMSVLQRLDHMVDVERNRLTAMEDIAQAAKTLYASLTPDQRHAADPRLANIVAAPAALGAAPAAPGPAPRR